MSRSFLGQSKGLDTDMAYLQRIPTQRLRANGSRLRPLPLSRLGPFRGGYRAYTATARRRQEVFPAQTEDASSSALLSSLKTPRVAQTLTEKIVQRSAPLLLDLVNY
jgi:homoaconitate hydratase